MKRPTRPGTTRRKAAKPSSRLSQLQAAASRERWRVPLGNPQRRLTIALVAVAVVASLMAARGLQLQGLDPRSLAQEATSETIKSQIIPATRGTITDRNGELLVISEPAVNVIADPYNVVTNGYDPQGMSARQKLRAGAGAGITAGVLRYYLGGSFDDYYRSLTTDYDDGGKRIRYAVMGKNVRNYTQQLIQQYLDELGYVGLGTESAPVRSYPNGSLAANLLGYVIYDEELDKAGKYPYAGGGGLELALDTQLAGIDGQEVYEVSSYGRIPTGEMTLQEPQEGISYQLTIDAQMQYMVEARIREMVTQHSAQSGTAIVMSIKTGEVLAMATYPSFDPNDLGKAIEPNLGLRPLTEQYEPGSVQKVLTMAALLDTGLAGTETRVEIPGELLSGGVMLHDFMPHDTWYLTATGVVAWSSNIGMALLTRQMDKQVLSDYLYDFGLGQRTGLNYPGEQAGEIQGGDMSDQTRDHMAFGQGLSVTAMQEAAAVAAVVNRGTYVSPTLIRQATTADGQPYDIPRQITRQVISPQASDDLLGMMEATNLDHNHSVPGYRTAGKTGTAERYNDACACYRGYVSSYVVVAPVEDPEILTYIVMDDPANNYMGSISAAPVGLDIMKVALGRYGVPVSTQPVPHYQIEW